MNKNNKSRLLVRDKTQLIYQNAILAASELDGVAQFFQLQGQKLAVVALDLDDPVLDRASGPAALLELAGQGFEPVGRQGQAGDAGDALAFAALGLAGDPDNAVARRRDAGTGAGATGRGLAAGGAHSALVRGIDQGGSAFRGYGHGVTLAVRSDRFAAPQAERADSPQAAYP